MKFFFLKQSVPRNVSKLKQYYLTYHQMELSKVQFRFFQRLIYRLEGIFVGQEAVVLSFLNNFFPSV